MSAIDLQPEEVSLAESVGRQVGSKWRRVQADDIVADLGLWLCENHKYVERWREEGDLGRNKLRLSLRRRAHAFCRGEHDVIKPHTPDYAYTPEAVRAVLEALFQYPDWSDIAADGDSDIWASLSDVSNAYETLNETDKLILRLRFGADLLLAEIAEKLELASDDTARMRVNRALQRVADRASGSTIRWPAHTDLSPTGTPWIAGKTGALE